MSQGCGKFKLEVQITGNDWQVALKPNLFFHNVPSGLYSRLHTSYLSYSHFNNHQMSLPKHGPANAFSSFPNCSVRLKFKSKIFSIFKGY